MKKTPQGVIICRDIALLSYLEKAYPKWLVLASTDIANAIEFIEAP